jgi:hypothetical protein
VVNVFGGEVGDSMLVEGQYYPKFSTANIYGGDIGPGLTIKEAVLNIFGGTVDPAITIGGHSTVTIHGTGFTLLSEDGEASTVLRELLPNVPYLLTQRTGTLSATLVDGSPFHLALKGIPSDPPDRPNGSGAHIFLVLVQVPEPATASLALLSLAGLIAIRRHSSNRKSVRFLGTGVLQSHHRVTSSHGNSSAPHRKPTNAR